MTAPTPPRNKGKRVIKMNAISYALMIKLMQEGIYTCQELATETGLHYVTVLQYTRELHRTGAAHICDWGQDSYGRDALKIYKIGAGKDQSRKKISMATRQARYRARLKAQDVLHRMAGTTEGVVQ